MQMQNGFSRTTDRFSLGGRSLRGFQYGQIGPREGNEPLGGENYAVSRVEANFPLGLPKELGFYGGLFAEAGSLWGLQYDTTKVSLDTNVRRFIPKGNLTSKIDILADFSLRSAQVVILILLK